MNAPETRADYAALGFRVIPLCTEVAGRCEWPGHRWAEASGAVQDCSGPGKRPLWQNWTDDKVGGPWLRKSNLGAVTRPWYVVVDVDLRNGGWDTLTTWQRQHGDLPDTWTVHTPTGGAHFYFLTAEPFDTKRDGVDILGPGRQAVLPPSRRSAGAYRWDEWLRPGLIEMAPLPDWVRGAATERTASSGSKAPATVTNLEIRDPAAYASRLVLRVREVPVGQGLRNEAFNRLAYRAGQISALLDNPEALRKALHREMLATGYEPGRVDDVCGRAFDEGAGG